MTLVIFGIPYMQQLIGSGGQSGPFNILLQEMFLVSLTGVGML